MTSPSGSALEDFNSTVTARWPTISVCLCGASVQGETAIADLVEAIQELEHDPTVEVIVVTRGGGADATLWVFNREPVVRAIVECTTPVVVAVGHEDDETLAERVADERAMTPTAAGVAVTPELEAIANRFETLERRIAEERLTALAGRITAGVRTIEQEAVTREATQQRVADLERRLTTAYTSLATTRLTEIDRRIDQAMQSIEQTAVTEQASATAARGRVADLEARIDQAYRQTVDHQLQTIEQRIDTAYREIETESKVQAGQAEAEKLRLVVAVLLVLLLLVAGFVMLLLL